MATTDTTTIRTGSATDRAHEILLAIAYAGSIVATVAAATGLAALLAGFTAGLGQFVLLAGGWLLVVSASPQLADRFTRRVAAVDFAAHAPRSSRAVRAAVSYLVAK